MYTSYFISVQLYISW